MHLSNIIDKKGDNYGTTTGFEFFLGEGSATISLTYGELQRKSCRVGSAIRSVVPDGSLGLLVLPPGIDYIVALCGFFQAGHTVIPTYPPPRRSTSRALERVGAIIKDARVTFGVCAADMLPFLRENEISQSIEWHSIESLLDGSLDLKRHTLGDEALALIQYTSGSTDNPKGVALTHRNLVSNLERIKRCFRHDRTSKGVIWLPPYHDMGLIGGILQPLFVGFPVLLMTPNQFAQRPARWMRAISTYRATTSGGPNFAYQRCTESVSDEELDGLDLSSWSVAFNGAEPVSRKVMDSFASRFARCGFKKEAFLPCYGLAEATLFVTGFQRDLPDELPADGNYVGCGTPAPEDEICIVDPKTTLLCKEGEMGEIWFSGEGVAEAYLGREQLSSSTFWNTLDQGTPGRFLRTGDLGFLRSGVLFVTGRQKDLVIVRGGNHHAEDIESRVSAHASVHSCAAFSVREDETEVLVIAVEAAARGKIEETELAATVCSTIAEFFAVRPSAVVVLRPGQIPRTLSGKPQRHLCRQRFLDGTLKARVYRSKELAVESGQISKFGGRAAFHSSNKIEEFLFATFKEKLDLDRLTPETALSSLCLDSLQFAELQFEIEKSLGTRLSFEDMGSAETISGLAKILAANDGKPSAVVDFSIETADTFPLSVGQQGLWFLTQALPSSSAYLLRCAVRIVGELDPGRLQEAFAFLIRRHPELNCRVQVNGDSPQQTVIGGPNGVLVLVEGTQWSETQIEDFIREESKQVFDLAHESPLRAKLVRVAENEHILSVVIHHLFCDFWSIEIVFEDLWRRYDSLGEESPPPDDSAPSPTGYGNFVNWQAEYVSSDLGIRDRAYWHQKLDGVGSLDLPCDHSRARSSKLVGGLHRQAIAADDVLRLRDFAGEAGVTMYSAALAVFKVLLAAYSRSSDIVVGSPFHGRTQAKFRDTVGYFVNPAVLRTDIGQRKSFRVIVDDVAQSVQEALDHQSYPYPSLVKELQPARVGIDTGLFQVMFVFEQAFRSPEALQLLQGRHSVAGSRLGGLRLEPVHSDTVVSPQFELTVLVSESKNGFLVDWHFDAEIYAPSTIERMARTFKNLLVRLPAAPEFPARRAELTSSKELSAIQQWNETSIHYAQPGNLDALIATQEASHPDRVAVESKSEILTYGKLDELSSIIANRLAELGVRADTPVLVCLDRSVELVVALRSIVKAGGAFLPVATNYPTRRIDYIINESDVSVVITDSNHSPKFDQHDIAQVILPLDQKVSPTGCSIPRRTVISPDQLAYVIYTSGTTGQPKGAMNTHRGISNRLLWMQKTFGLAPGDRVLQKTPITFDVSVWEFFWPLVAGATVVMAKPEGHRDAHYLAKVIAESQITVLHFVPSMLSVMLVRPEFDKLSSLRLIMASGEALPADLVEQCAHRNNAQLHNLYGPTEAAIDVTWWDCRSHVEGRPVPIGRPIDNLRCHILTDTHQLAPVGVPGQLFLGGAGLGRGYRSAPRRTAEAFRPDLSGIESGARIYQTGDIARYDESGLIEYLGREDEQVKVRGRRIELGEVAACAKAHASVRDAVAIVHTDRRGESSLWLFAVKEPSVSEDFEDVLRDWLGNELPEYQLPDRTVLVDHIHATVNGKTDKARLLAEAPLHEAHPRQPYVAPRTPVECQLAEIWSEELGIETIGIHDKFFDLGGHSLVIARITGSIREAFGVEIPMDRFFKAPTVEKLALEVTSMQMSQKESEEIFELLDQLEDLSEEDLAGFFDKDTPS